MSDQPPIPSASKLPHLIREKVGELGESVQTWKADLRENPAQFLASPLVRIPFWIVVGIVLLLLGRAAISAWTPTQAGRNFEQATTTATVYVACTNPSCLHSFQAQVPMDWKKDPLTCSKCGQKSAVRATLCSKCRQWYAVPADRAAGCPLCAARAAAAASKPTKKKTAEHSDDAEDGW